MMNRYLRFTVGFLGLALLASVPLRGQGSILFQMNYSSGAWATAGWPNAEPLSSRWSRQLVAGAGPQGQNVAQLTELPGTGQHDWGWDGNVAPALAQGGTRFYRWRHRVTAASNCAATPSNKLLIIGQGCSGGRCRVIVQPKCSPSGMVQYNFQVDGGLYQMETGYIYPKGTWLNIQLETRTSSSTSANDGALRLWVNNNNQSSPTIRNEGINLIALNAQYIIFGGYNNTDNVSSSATNVQQYTDFTIATGFHSGWASGASSPPPPPPPPPTAPSAPTNLRILSMF